MYHQTSQGPETFAAFLGRRHVTGNPILSSPSSSYASRPPDLLGTEGRQGEEVKEGGIEERETEDEEIRESTDTTEQKGQCRSEEKTIKNRERQEIRIKNRVLLGVILCLSTISHHRPYIRHGQSYPSSSVKHRKRSRTGIHVISC